MELNAEQIVDILDKMDFFQGQRAGRELWNDKPFEVQEQDIANFSSDISSIKEYITSQEQRIGAQDMTISELRKKAEKAEHDADRYARRIKELTEEVESLKQCMEHEHASFMETFGEYGEKCERLTEENERLRDNLDRTEKALIAVDKAHNDLFTDTFRIEAEAKADTVRKMQERLKAHLEKPEFPWDSFTVAEEVIDQIAKEMLEDKPCT